MSFFSRLLGQLKTSTFFKHTLILVTGTASAQFITVAATPLLSRLYSPAEFGKWAVFLAVSSITATLVTLRYETAILLPKDDRDAFRLVWLSGFLVIGLGSLLVVGAWIVPGFIKELLGVDVLGEYLSAAILTGVGMAVVAVGNNWLNRSCAYGKMSMIRLIQSIALVGFSLLLGTYGISNGLLVSQVFSLLLVSVITLWLLRESAFYPTAASIIALAKSYHHAPKYLLPTALLDAITLQLPIFLITAWFNSEMAGQFSMAWKILTLPSALIGAAAGQVFYQKISKIIYTNDRLIITQYLKVTSFLIIISLPIGIVVFNWGSQLFVFLLGEQWLKAGAIAELLVLSSLMYFVFSPTSSILIVYKKNYFLLFFGITQLFYRWYAAEISNSVEGYVRWLVLFEIINVIFFEIVVMYVLFFGKKNAIIKNSF